MEGSAAVPNRSIEIHDSILERISFCGSEAQVCFELAYIHQSEGLPGRDAGQVWTQTAVLRIGDATVSGVFSQLPARLSDGSAVLGANSLDNTIPVPLHHEGKFKLRLQSDESEVVTVSGIGARLELLGEAKYLEEFHP
jgi:hypothetical protein